MNKYIKHIRSDILFGAIGVSSTWTYSRRTTKRWRRRYRSDMATSRREESTTERNNFRWHVSFPNKRSVKMHNVTYLISCADRIAFFRIGLVRKNLLQYFVWENPIAHSGSRYHRFRTSLRFSDGKGPEPLYATTISFIYPLGSWCYLIQIYVNPPPFNILTIAVSHWSASRKLTYGPKSHAAPSYDVQLLAYDRCNCSCFRPFWLEERRQWDVFRCVSILETKLRR